MQAPTSSSSCRIRSRRASTTCIEGRTGPSSHEQGPQFWSDPPGTGTIVVACRVHCRGPNGNRDSRGPDHADSSSKILRRARSREAR
jgi:hypothetical protein